MWTNQVSTLEGYSLGRHCDGMCLDLRHSGNFLSDSLRVGRAFGVFLVKGIKVLAAPVLSGHFAWVRDLRILQLDLLSEFTSSLMRKVKNSHATVFMLCANCEEFKPLNAKCEELA
ncbi:hypothetical protein L6452_31231 [Arctium lappa]|uniref:Uncharacterized protein n=1 Tax=Arctium lappa TaxID=4217 RepID=A0ACB8ZK91_ARCLA|nr:hypothetical protein L6452_31231 [Arctium lappa]